MTLEPSHPDQPTNGESMSSAVDSRARISAMPEAGPDWQVSEADSGTNMPASLASWDRDSLQWRTSQRSLIEGLMPFAGPFPTWGLMRSGELYQRAPLVPRNTGNVFFCWPTPNAMSGTLLRQRETPACFASHRRRHADKGQRKQLTLEVAVKAFPTGPIPWTQEEMIRHILSTPLGSMREHGETNPTWCEWLMGFPMGWTDCMDSAIASSPKSPNGSDAES